MSRSNSNSLPDAKPVDVGCYLAKESVNLRAKIKLLQYLAPILYFIPFAFAASVLVFIPKIIFFLKQRNAYEYILIHALVAVIVGIGLAYGVYFYSRPNVVEDEGEHLIAIPFYCMLTGIIIGIVRFYLSEKYTKRRFRSLKTSANTGLPK